MRPLLPIAIGLCLAACASPPCLNVTGGTVPTAEEVDRFVENVRALPDAGMDRARTFLLLYDILKNGKREDLGTIVKRHGDPLHPDYGSLPEGDRARARERASLIRGFFEFNGDVDPLKSGAKWTDWTAGKVGEFGKNP